MADKETKKTEADALPGAALVDDKIKATNPAVRDLPKSERDALQARLDAAAKQAAEAVHGPEAYTDPKSPFYLPPTQAEAMTRVADQAGVAPALPEPYRMEDGGDYRNA